MTDQTAHEVTDEERLLAREWAESIESATNSVEPATNPWSDRAVAAARVILRTIPAPPPQRPTLADMTKAERGACEWMQCDVKDEVIRAVIINPHWESGSARVLWQGAFIEQIDWERVTPRPDLPRLTWPGDTPAPAAPAPALPDGWRLADHKHHGRVVVTNPTPDRDGRVYFVAPTGGAMGNARGSCDPGELTYLDQEAEDVTPAPKAGDTIESAADPRLPNLPVGSILLDRDGETVAKRNEEWVGLGRIPVPSEGGEFGPWEVIHTGLEADQ